MTAVFIVQNEIRDGGLSMIKRMPIDRKQAIVRGAMAESRALAYLQQQGLALVERNYACRWGEIDLIMREAATLVFVEVRQRSSQRYGGAAASVGAVKQARLWRTAEHYLQQHAASTVLACRFDLFAIDGEQVEWIRDIIGH